MGGVAGVVQPSVPHTLLVQTEQRGRPCTETVGLLEHSQRELLQTKNTKTQHVLFLGLQKKMNATNYFNAINACVFFVLGRPVVSERIEFKIPSTS